VWTDAAANPFGSSCERTASSRSWRGRICGPLKPLVDFQGNVLVKFGYEKQFERAEETACYQGEIDTPGTPSTQRTPSPSPPAKRRRMCPNPE